MAEVTLRIRVRRRWFFWPAYYVIGTLHRLGIVRDLYPACSWLAEHGNEWRAA